ncbi:hypothetical protein O3P69_017362 [Scylla paramamosain]|uniref:Integrase catalytic domain-containing protein n=1 Tax=Scylla paramamosain TaxID=85552 RepID=A0AAW0SBD6_SCYPA
MRGGSRFHAACAAGTAAESGEPASADVAAARTPAAPSRKNLPPCGYCGDSHAPGRSNCPARTVTCSYCNKVGHMKKCCRSRRGHPASASKQAAPASPLSEVSSAVTVADAHSTPQPTIDVIVSRGDGKEERKASAVADTGAQVCVAGPSLLHTLGIEPSQLQSRAGLRDVANLRLRCMGSTICQVTLGKRSTIQDVYIIQSARQFYLSLAACKALGLWEGHTYMAYADRLTGWLEVAHFPNGASSYKIQTQLRKYFSRYGAPEHMSMDGGTNLTSAEMDTFYRNWGVSVRLSSAQYPQSNGRAEVAVKTAKRIIRDNTSPGGSLDNDKATLAILQYLNTPLRCINKSPAQLATGRQLRDGVPMAGQHLRLDQYWSQTLRKRERLMAEEQEAVTASDTPRSLQPLSTGARVRIQNQASNRWDRTGVKTEVLPYRQYTVCESWNRQYPWCPTHRKPQQHTHRHDLGAPGQTPKQEQEASTVAERL